VDVITRNRFEMIPANSIWRWQEGGYGVMVSIPLFRRGWIHSEYADANEFGPLAFLIRISWFQSGDGLFASRFFFDAYKYVKTVERYEY